MYELIKKTLIVIFSKSPIIYTSGVKLYFGGHKSYVIQKSVWHGWKIVYETYSENEWATKISSMKLMGAKFVYYV